MACKGVMPYSYDRRAARPLFSIKDLIRFLSSKCQAHRHDPKKFKLCCGEVLDDLGPTHAFSVMADKLEAEWKWGKTVEKALKLSLETYD